MKAMVGVFLMVLAAVSLAQQAPNLTVAVIDVQQIVQESAAGKEAMARLKKLTDEKMAEGRKLAEAHQALEKQLTTQGPTLSDEKRSELAKQIEDKEIEMRRFDEDARAVLDEARRKELDALERQIMPIINELGRELKLQLIFNKYQSGLVYADDAVDITDQVLRRFNTRVTK
jgi:outer membrane protein